MARRAKKRRKYLFEGLVLFTVGAFIVTVALAGSVLYINSNIQKNEVEITTLSNELTSLQKQIEEIQNQEKEYKNQLDELQGELSKYEPVVIPDSMKTN